MYRIAVIGAGVAGYTTALEAARRGIKTALVEKEVVGGTCLNRGCIPTKTYLRKAEEIRMGIHKKDSKSTAKEIECVVEKLRWGLTSSLTDPFIDIFKGTAEIIDEHTIRIEESQTNLTAEYIVIATGSVPNVIRIPGADSRHVFTTDHAFDPENIFPDSIAIIGGGVIGIEFAYLLNSVGTKVSVFEVKSQILQGMTRSFSETIENDLAIQGIKFYKESVVRKIEDEDGELVITFTESEKKRQVVVAKVLMAAGRKADLTIAGISRLGIKIKDGKVRVDHNCQTNVKQVYAAGDVACGVQLAYVAALQAKKIVDHICGIEQASISEKLIPRCVYIHPEIAVIGLSEEEANCRRNDYQIVKYLMGANGRSQLEKKTKGFIKLIISRQKHTVLGAEMYCEHAIDMIPLLESFIMNQTDVRTISRMHFPHPSFVEGIRECVGLAEVIED